MPKFLTFLIKLTVAQVNAKKKTNKKNNQRHVFKITVFNCVSVIA